jgi:S-adenosyl-L-methionine hydrolase (adenosine-forming)
LYTEAKRLPGKIVTLTSDFGLKDPYVAEMKAVILSIYSDAVIVDVTHEIEKFNIRMGAFMLASAAPYFPKGTVHVGVVDPGVGTERRSLLVQTRQGFFVGPDNGLLILAAEKQGITSIREITNPKLMLARVSNTFHGRDVFAPAAAHLANGVPPSDFGPEIRDVVKPKFTKVKISKDALIGEVLNVDGFGNVITNVNENDMTQLHAGDWITAELPNCNLKLRFGKAYAEAKPKEALALIGSHGYVELAVNQGNAAETFQTKIGDKVKLSISSKQ